MNGGKLVTILIVIVAVALGVMNGAGNREAARNFEAKAKEFAQKANALMQRQMAGEDVTDEQMKIFDDFLAEADKTGNAMNGRDAKAMRAMAVSMRELQPAVKGFDNEVKAFAALGELASDRVKGKDEIAARRAGIKRVLEANDALARTFANLPATMEAKLRAAGISDADVGRFMSGSGQLAVVAQVRQCDRAIFTAMDGQMKMLEDHWGKWKGAADGSFDFQDENLNNQFQALYTTIEAELAKQTQFQQQAMNNMNAALR